MNIQNFRYAPQFKSNIKIVSPNDFNLMTWEASRNEGVDEIYNYLLKDTYQSDDKKWKCYRTNSQNVSTEAIRSCTGGLVIDENAQKANLAMHVYDDKHNYNKLSTLNPYLHGTNAFLMGGREKYEYSLGTFEHFSEELAKNNVPTTIFKDFQDCWEGDFAYIAKSNDILVCIKNIMNPKKYVKNMEELIKAFKQVVISPKDNIQFIDSAKSKLISLKK